MNIHEIAEMTGLSVRTLHHYDAISLLTPSRNPENGYREYKSEDIDKLQQILFFRECGFSLTKIRRLLDSPDFDRAEAFQMQKRYLLHEKRRIDQMLETLEKSLQALKGESNMSEKEKFEGFDFRSNPYEQEARERWGDESVDQSNAYAASLSPEGKKTMEDGMNHLFRELAEIRGEAPDSAIAQKAMDKMFCFFNENFGIRYSPEAFAGLGQMYTSDERFTKNIDQFGEGLSAFLAKAMGIFAQRQ